MKHCLLLFLCLLTVVCSEAQDLSASWSRNITYDPNTTGEFSEFAGANSKYVYGVFEPTNDKYVKKNRILIAYDKLTMKQMGKVSIKSSTGNFENIRVTEEVIYVLVLDDTKGKEVLYAQTYTPSLDVISTRKKIYQITTSTKGASKSVTSIKSYVNSKANNYLYIISEKPNVKDENVKVVYNVFDGSLSTVHTGQIELPVKSTRSTASNLSNFSVGDNGMLIAKNFVKADQEIRKEDKVYSYSILSVIDPEKKSIKSLPIRASGKHINDFEYFSRDNKLCVVGIYSESIGKRSERGNGVFSATLNETSGELEGTEFSEINAPGIRFSDLYLEKLKISEDGKMMLFATEDENIVIAHRSRNGTTYTYENRKGDILAVSLHRDGTLNWKNIIERRFTYNTLYVRDIQVMLDEENAYLTYADRFNKGRKSFFNKRSKKEMRDFLNYAKIGIKNGTQELRTYKINASNVAKENLKLINASRVSELDNMLFLDGYNLKVKPSAKIITCATAPLCGIGCLYYFIKAKNGTLLKGGGYLGSLKLK